MKNCYKPKEDPALTNFHFRAITQSSEETYPESKKKPSTVTLNATKKTVQPIVVRDQIVTGLQDKGIQEETLKISWILKHCGLKT